MARDACKMLDTLSCVQFDTVSCVPCYASIMFPSSYICEETSQCCFPALSTLCQHHLCHKFQANTFETSPDMVMELKAGKLCSAVPFAWCDSDLSKMNCHGTFTEDAMLQGAWFHGAGSTPVRIRLLSWCRYSTHLSKC